MLPLIVTTFVSHVAAYFATGELTWLLSGGIAMSIGPYTGVILGEDIAALRAADSKGVGEITRRFCRLHHPRTIIGLTAFVINLRHLTHL